MPVFNRQLSRVAGDMAGERQRERTLKPKPHVVLTLPGEGSALGRLGVGVQARATARPGASNHPRLLGYRGVRGLG